MQFQLIRSIVSIVFVLIVVIDYVNRIYRIDCIDCINCIVCIDRIDPNILNCSTLPLQDNSSDPTKYGITFWGQKGEF